MRESDLLLIHRDIGVFVIEAKTFRIDALQDISPVHWRISGRDTTQSPILQAYQQYEGLRDFLSPIYGKLPPICATVFFPKISRKTFIQRFHASNYAKSIAESVFFSEDIFAGAEIFTKRLLHAFKKPPCRQGRDPHTVPDKFVNLIKDLLASAKPNTPTASERERLKLLERGITRELQAQYPIGGGSTGIFTGPPGTGKTFRLLSIACFHAYSGSNVLFSCFNKTLASDIRRLLAFDQKLNASRGRIVVLDVNQLAVRCFDTNGLSFFECEDHDEWGKIVVQQLSEKDGATIEPFDVVLVDEVQDMNDWQLDLLALHAGNGATIALAMGKGQELYRDSASAERWLASLEREKRAIKHSLRRNFRNPQPQFLVAKAFHDSWPNKYQYISSTFRRAEQKPTQNDLAFDRKDGEQPRYITLPVSPAEFEDDGALQISIAGESFADVLGDTVSRLDEDENLDPVGILVLVPTVDGLHCLAARVALNKICESRKIDYIDYTIDTARRSSARQDQIRLCTFHSARGLEGEHVVVFGLEQLEALGEASEAPCENLAFVALSRGVFSNTVVCRSRPRGLVHELCERIWKELNSE